MIKDRDVIYNKLIYIIIIVFFFALFITAYLKYLSFETNSDLATYYQAFGNLLYGDASITIQHPEGRNIFGIHSQYIFFLILPIYALFPGAGTLIFLNSLFLVLGAYPIYLLAKEKFYSTFAGLSFAICYLLQPGLWYVNGGGFHAIPIAMTFAAFAFYYVYKKDYKKFAIFYFLLLMCKESVSLICITLGIYIFFVNKNKRLGILTIIVSAIWFIFVVWFMLPYFSAGSEIRSQQVITTFIQNPSIILYTIKPISLYLFTLFFPLLFISLLSPSILFIVAPIFLTAFQYNTIFNHRCGMLIPFIVIAGIYSVVKIVNSKYCSKIFSKITKNTFNKKTFLNMLCILLILSSLISNIGYGPVGVIRYYADDLVGEPTHHGSLTYFPSERDEIAKKMIKEIPLNSTVASDAPLLAHFPIRKGMYWLYDINATFVEQNKIDCVLFDTESFEYIHHNFNNLLLNISANQNYDKSEEDGYILFKRKGWNDN